jgi:hypothetical protein
MKGKERKKCRRRRHEDLAKKEITFAMSRAVEEESN